LVTVLVLPLMALDGLDWSLWSIRYELIFYAGIVLLLSVRGKGGGDILPIVAWVIGLDSAFVLTSLLATDIMWALPLGNYGSCFMLGLILYLWKVREIRCGRLVLLAALALANTSVEMWWKVSAFSEALRLPARAWWEGGLIAATMFSIVLLSIRGTEQAVLR